MFPKLDPREDLAYVYWFLNSGFDYMSHGGMEYYHYRFMIRYKDFSYFIDNDDGKTMHMAFDHKYDKVIHMPVTRHVFTPIPFEYFKMWVDWGQPTLEEVGGNTRIAWNAYHELWMLKQLEEALELES